MRFEGNLTAWNPERGYGGITPQQGGQELFVHISAFSRDGEPPAIGEPLSFEIVTASDGRKQAGRVLRSRRAAPPAPAGFMAPAPPRRPSLAARRRRRLMAGGIVLASIVGVLGWWHLATPHAEQVALQVGALMPR